MNKLQNYALGQWLGGTDDGQILYNAVNGEPIAAASSKGVDFEAMLHYARTVGGPKLRKMTFHERGRMLRALALYLHERRMSYYPISYQTGATKADSWIDIEGGIGNLFSYASLRRQFPNESYYVDGDIAVTSKQGTFIGHHIMVPKEGVAIHINAFNFPIWGMLEKIAVNLLAGVPAVVKPATITSYLTEAMVRDIIASGILPQGALQLICGSAGNLLDFVTDQDVVTLTGSAETGKKLKSHPRIIAESVPFNLEADSLNCSVLAPDAVPGTPEFDLFIKEVRKEMTIKCGQKCTAIRRIIVPSNLVEAVGSALSAALAKTVIGNPAKEGVHMGALAGKAQVQEVSERVKLLSENATTLYGSLAPIDALDADGRKGAFMSPILLLQPEPFKYQAAHNIEAFGPVSTILPYDHLEEAIALSKLGKGSLCSSIVTANPTTARDYTISAAGYHGRILVLNAECAKESTGHGSPLPMLVHGGPGRAGGGEEMGGMRGVKHYMQRCAIQGSPTMITAVTNVYQYGAKQTEHDKHPFRKYFEELEIGETVVTHKHTVSEADIVNFANVSGDNFYAHMDATSLDGTIFTQRVAHGYFVLAKAAGLFVDPKKGPVLLNYGLEECRFIKPVYPGMTIGVRLTVKAKVDQEKKSDEDIAKGIVKFLVDVYDETGESVAIATILTMVKKQNQTL
jgi:oxepin-CoA hydrolase/3-oxo-5,6-dehydrosuberyl-CoA semialdehyde dehydrogenase